MGKSILATFKTRLKKFVSELRASGDDKITGTLCKTRGFIRGAEQDDCKGFCALGMAIEVYRKATGDGRWVEYRKGTVDEDGRWYFEMDGDFGQYYTHMPEKIQEWYGLDTDWSHAFPTEVIDRNDNKGDDFNRIADYVERNVQYGHTSGGKDYFRTGLE